MPGRVGAGAGVDDVDRQAGAGGVLGPYLGRHFERRLRGAVRVRADPVHRVELGRDVDDAAPALRDHAGRDAARQPVGGQNIRRHHVFDDLVGYLPEALHLGAAVAVGIDIGKGQPGIVDQNVEPAEAVPRLGDDPVALARLAQIGNKRPDLPGNAERPRLGLDLADIGRDVPDRGDPMPGARQPQYHRPPETAQPAGHQRHSVRHASSRVYRRFQDYRCPAEPCFAGCRHAGRPDPRSNRFLDQKAGFVAEQPAAPDAARQQLPVGRSAIRGCTVHSPDSNLQQICSEQPIEIFRNPLIILTFQPAVSRPAGRCSKTPTLEDKFGEISDDIGGIRDRAGFFGNALEPRRLRDPPGL